MDDDQPIRTESELRQLEQSAAMGPLTPNATRPLIATVRWLWGQRGTVR